MTVIITRDEYCKIIKAQEVSNRPIETCNRSVMESYDKDGVLLASAECSRSVQGEPCMITYRKPDKPRSPCDEQEQLVRCSRGTD